MTKAQWLASVPSTFDAKTGRELMVTALKDANDQLDVTRDAFHGTLPPPPWPATPEMVKAIDAADGGRIFFDKAVGLSSIQRWTKESKTGRLLVKAGSDLYDQSDALAGRLAQAKSIADMLPSPMAGLRLVVLALVLLVLAGRGVVGSRDLI